MDRPWPLSAGIPGRSHNQSPDALPAIPEHRDADARVLFARKFWGRRRFSDSVSQLPHHARALRQLDRDSRDDSNRSLNFSSRRRRGNPRLSATPTSARSLRLPSSSLRSPIRPASHRQTPNTTGYTFANPHLGPLSTAASVAPEHSFLEFPGYQPHAIKPRHPVALPNRREEFADALGKIEAKSGKVSIKGAGHLARPIIMNNTKYLSNLNHFLDHAERSLLVPRSFAPTATPLSLATPMLIVQGQGQGQGQIPVLSPLSAGSVAVSSCPQTPLLPAVAVAMPGTGTGAAAEMNQRDLIRLESEVFDTAKYSNVGGSAAARHLTVLTWSEDRKYGTVTLFEVDLEVERSAAAVGVGGHTSGLAARRRHATPAALYTQRGRERVVGLRPVAAMEDVPRQVLVTMRVDQGLKKVVLRRDKGRERFRWKAQHTRRGWPRYARLWAVDGFRDIRTAIGTGFYDDRRTRSTRRSGRRDVRRGGEEGSLGVEGIAAQLGGLGILDKDDISPGADGVVATIPQFLALLHASRSIIEKMSSAPATTRRVETEDGERTRAVSLSDAPQGTRHRGRDVHVVVLVPDGTRWAEERIFWTGSNGGLAELRQKKYRDVIDRGRARTRRARRAYDSRLEARDLGLRRPSSPLLAPRTARW